MNKPRVGRSESEVLRFIAEKGSGVSVTQVGDYLNATKGQTRNTALNMMERLRKKGFLVRQKIEGVYQYSPADSKANLFEGFVADFVEGFLGGSITPLVAYLGTKTQVDDDQLAELKRLVRSLDGGKDVS